MLTNSTLFLFRNDLRLNDNAALAAACKSGQPLILLYILDQTVLDDKKRGIGGASRWWLHHSLRALAEDIAARGGRLILRKGRTLNILDEIIAAAGVKRLYFSRGYEPAARGVEEDIHARYHDKIEIKRFAGYLLFEPEQIAQASGLPYKVFTPFWRACLAEAGPYPAGSCPDKIPGFNEAGLESEALASWGLLPGKPDWAAGLRQTWRPGEKGASLALDKFLDGAAADYDAERNRPDRDGTSCLSPHLHFGEIAPARVWRQTRARIKPPAARKSAMAFLRELGWREFSTHLLFHWPTLPEKPFRPEFAEFPWAPDERALAAWQRGLCGYPLVDAGMRQLWRTGWMHNRVRMVTASFLVKHLLIHWREGEAWFWDTLVDADLANNAASWQWVAGSGADAAPYFRIFNPILQGKKFDPEGIYIRKWAPELKKLPTKYLHEPWLAPAPVLADAGVRLGENYPLPLVEHSAARARALAAFRQIKKEA